jgi:cell division protein FtsL
MPAAYADRAAARSRTASGRESGRTGRPAAGRSPGVRVAAAAPRVRWDRLGRLAMLFVLAALLYLYLSAGVRMYSTWGQSRHDKATVASLEREHAKLAREHESLGRQGTVEAEARRLGMKRANERQYEISGLPSN